MPDFISNCPVSWPIRIADVIPEINLSGVMFSYRYGLMYNPSEQPMQMRTPFTPGPR